METAKERAVSPRFRNKLLTSLVALVASSAFIGAAVLLDALAPHGALGWLVKTIPLAVAIPVILIGYETACDWYYKRFILGENRRFFTEQMHFEEATDANPQQLEPPIIGSQRPSFAGPRRVAPHAAFTSMALSNGAAAHRRGPTTIRIQRWYGQ